MLHHILLLASILLVTQMISSQFDYGWQQKHIHHSCLSKCFGDGYGWGPIHTYIWYSSEWGIKLSHNAGVYHIKWEEYMYEWSQKEEVGGVWNTIRIPFGNIPQKSGYKRGSLRNFMLFLKFGCVVLLLLPIFSPQSFLVPMCSSPCFLLGCIIFGNHFYFFLKI